MRRRSADRVSGHTLIEAVVAMGVLALVMASTFIIYQTGTAAWHQGSVRSDLAGQMHLVSAAVATACDQSSFEGVTISPDGQSVAVCSPTLDDGKFDLDTATGTLTWHRWVVVWFDPGSQEVRRGQLPMPTSAQQVTPIQNVLPDWFDNPPAQFAVSVRDIDSFQAQWVSTAPPILELNLEGSKRRYGRVDEETVSTRTSFRVGRP